MPQLLACADGRALFVTDGPRVYSVQCQDGMATAFAPDAAFPAVGEMLRMYEGVAESFCGTLCAVCYSTPCLAVKRAGVDRAQTVETPPEVGYVPSVAGWQDGFWFAYLGPRLKGAGLAYVRLEDTKIRLVPATVLSAAGGPASGYLRVLSTRAALVLHYVGSRQLIWLDEDLELRQRLSIGGTTVVGLTANRELVLLDRKGRRVTLSRCDDSARLQTLHEWPSVPWQGETCVTVTAAGEVLVLTEDCELKPALHATRASWDVWEEVHGDLADDLVDDFLQSARESLLRGGPSPD